MPADTPRSVRWLPEDGAWRRFEFTSRGDRVRARLHLPPGAGHPLALFATGDAARIPATEGLATLTLDLPLLGARRSPKWTERLSACIAEGPAGAGDRALVDEFLAQAVLDLGAAIDVCAGMSEIDGERIGVVGIGPGAPAAARLQTAEPRIRASVLSSVGVCAALAPRDEPDEPGRPRGAGVVLTTRDSDAAAAARTLRAALED